MQRREKVAIVGGGISGLSIAYQLAKDPRWHVCLYESEKHPGGKIRTLHDQGFAFEWGPMGFLNNAPDTIELIEELGLQKSVIRPKSSAKKRYIVKNEKLLPVPMDPISLLQTPLIGISSKLAIAKEFFSSHHVTKEDESIDQFMGRHFGQDITRTLVDAMISGIHAGDISALSMHSCFPKLVKLEKKHASLLKGLIKQKKKGKTELLSFVGGMQDLIAGLSARLTEMDVEMRMASPIASIKASDQGGFVVRANGSEARYDQVISTVPAHCWKKLLPEVMESAALAAPIAYAPVMVIGLGFDPPIRLPEGFGFLVPRKEKMRTLGCIFESNVFAHRAPEGKVALRAMIGGAHDPGIVNCSSEELAQMVLHDLRTLMPDLPAPICTQVFAHQQAIPQYNIGHREKLVSVKQVQAKYPGLIFAGNALHGISLNNCVTEAKKVAQRLSAQQVIVACSSLPQ